MNILLDKKQEHEKEKADLRKRTQKRVANAKKNNVIEKTWYERRMNDKVYKVYITSNGNKKSTLLGYLKERDKKGHIKINTRLEALLKR